MVTCLIFFLFSVAEEDYEEMDDYFVDEEYNEKESEEGTDYSDCEY